MEEKKVVEIEEINESEGILAKTKNFIKKNGKKIVTGIAAIGAAGLIGYGIGKYKSDEGEDSDFYDETDENLESTEDETDEVEEV